MIAVKRRRQKDLLYMFFTELLAICERAEKVVLTKLLHHNHPLKKLVLLSV